MNRVRLVLLVIPLLVGGCVDPRAASTPTPTPAAQPIRAEDTSVAHSAGARPTPVAIGELKRTYHSPDFTAVVDIARQTFQMMPVTKLAVQADGFWVLREQLVDLETIDRTVLRSLPPWVENVYESRDGNVILYGEGGPLSDSWDGYNSTGFVGWFVQRGTDAPRQLPRGLHFQLSPNGDFVSYVELEGRNAPARYPLILVDVATGNDMIVPWNSSSDDATFGWSPSGRFIAGSRDRDEVMVYDVQTNNMLLIESDAGRARWQPDGRLRYRRDGRWRLYDPLTAHEAEEEPAPSPPTPIPGVEFRQLPASGTLVITGTSGIRTITGLRRGSCWSSTPPGITTSRSMTFVLLSYAGYCG